MTVTKKPDTPPGPYVRFYNEAAADDKVFRDRIYGQIYNDKNKGYGANLTLQQLFAQSEDDPQLAAALSSMFNIEGADRRAFTDRFTKDVDFARMYADVEGGRGEAQTFKTIAPKYRGDRSLPDNQGECGAGSGIACDPGLAKELGKRRTAKGASAKDKILARIGAAYDLRGVAPYERNQYEGIYDRYGERMPDEHRALALTSLADGDVTNLMTMLGAMAGQGNNMPVMQPSFNIAF